MSLRVLFAVVLAAGLLWGLGGSTVCWQAVQSRHYQARCQAAETDATGRDTLLASVRSPRLHWLAPGELLVGNRHFDVVRTERTGAGLQLVGSYDGDDDRLSSVLAGLWQKEPPGDRGKMPPLFALEAVEAPVALASPGVPPVPSGSGYCRARSAWLRPQRGARPPGPPPRA